jgi:predicted nucleotidyltransferase
MNDLSKLENILRAQKHLLHEEYSVKSIGIFGSVIRHEQQNESDVDILVAFDRAIDLLTFVHLKNYLSDILQVNVDLVMKKALK